MYSNELSELSLAEWFNSCY